MTRRRPATPHGRRLLPGAVALVALAPAAGLRAADQWYFEPKASAELLYDTNIGLATNNAADSAGVNGRVDLRGGRRSETTDVLFNAAVVSRGYFDASQYDTTDFFFNGSASRKYERDLLRLDASVDYDSTLTSELETSGLVQRNERRQRYYLAPSWTRTLDERTSLQLYASAADVSYENAGATTGLVDYDAYVAGLMGVYLLSEVTQGTLRLTYDRYDAKDVLSTVDSGGVAFGLKHAFTETLSGRIELGVRYSESEFLGANGAPTSETSWGPLSDFGLTWRRETGQIDVSAGRSLVPSGSGSLLDTTRLSLSAREDLSERWSVSGVLSAFHNRNDLEDGRQSTNDRDYLDFRPVLSYRLTEWWRLDASYRYRWQKYDNQDGAADSNAVFLNVSYTWPREPLARWSELE